MFILEGGTDQRGDDRWPRPFRAEGTNIIQTLGVIYPRGINPEDAAFLTTVLKGCLPEVLRMRKNFDI